VPPPPDYNTRCINYDRGSAAYIKCNIKFNKIRSFSINIMVWRRACWQHSLSTGVFLLLESNVFQCTWQRFTPSGNGTRQWQTVQPAWLSHGSARLLTYCMGADPINNIYISLLSSVLSNDPGSTFCIGNSPICPVSSFIGRTIHLTKGNSMLYTSRSQPLFSPVPLE
jgi:hypothetical protein